MAHERYTYLDSAQYGPNRLTSSLLTDPHKIYFDDESHNHGHGHAYETYGIDPERGALVVVRPDQCKYTSDNTDHDQELTRIGRAHV